MVGAVDSRYEAGEAGVAATAVQGPVLEGLAAVARQPNESNKAPSIENSAQRDAYHYCCGQLPEVAQPAVTRLCCMMASMIRRGTVNM